MDHAKLVMLMTCHQLEPGGLGHTMRSRMGPDAAVIGYNGPGTRIHEEGLQWVNERLWTHLAAGMSARAATAQTIEEWKAEHPGWDADWWFVNELTCEGNATIAPAF